MNSKMTVEMVNTSIAHHEPLQIWPSDPVQLRESVLGPLLGWHTWQYAVTFLLAIVVYDQGKQFSHD